jgi:hypothetical protein
LLRSPAFRPHYGLRRFCANLLKLSNIHLPVKPNLLIAIGPLQYTVGGKFFLAISTSQGKGKPHLESVALRKISNINRQ